MEKTMTANAIGGTARIYQFPKGGRAGLSSGRYEAMSTKTDASKRIAWVACGGATYHEDAIREEMRMREN
jgi:hypothetical protein